MTSVASVKHQAILIHVVLVGLTIARPDLKK
jgi:hypothetical protein